ncbi:MAG: addiction module protein [Planctomycetota bacterium]
MTETTRDSIPLASEQLLNQALRLPTKERAALAAELLASLDEEPEPQEEVDAAWGAEIQRRLERVRAGEPGIPWETVRDELRARLKERRGG